MQSDPTTSDDFRTLLIIDDHPLFFDALSMTLQAVSKISRVYHAETLADAESLLQGGVQVDLITLDLNLPDVGGIEGLLRLQKQRKSPVLVVSSLSDARIINSVMAAGAQGFVPKHSSREIFAEAISMLKRGAQFLPNGHVLQSQQDDTGDVDAVERIASLTRQQARILQLICEGKLNKQIAYELAIAETTVKAHVTAIMRKLGVQSRTQAVLIANQVSFAHTLRENKQS
jgi:DNA-binding NarL/FixJ family response regulator